MPEFGHVTCRVVGSPDKGFDINHYPDGERFPSYKEAEKAGWEMYDSDDFYIAEYENDKCVAVFKYVDDDFEAGEQRITDEEEISEVNRCIV